MSQSKVLEGWFLSVPLHPSRQNIRVLRLNLQHDYFVGFVLQQFQILLFHIITITFWSSERLISTGSEQSYKNIRFYIKLVDFKKFLDLWRYHSLTDIMTCNLKQSSYFFKIMFIWHFASAIFFRWSVIVWFVSYVSACAWFLLFHAELVLTALNSASISAGIAGKLAALLLLLMRLPNTLQCVDVQDEWDMFSLDLRIAKL